MLIDKRREDLIVMHRVLIKKAGLTPGHRPHLAKGGKMMSVLLELVCSCNTIASLFQNASQGGFLGPSRQTEQELMTKVRGLGDEMKRALGKLLYPVESGAREKGRVV